MKQQHLALAVDLGGSSGKLLVGSIEDGIAEFTPVHRFDNKIVMVQGKAYWDFLRIFDEIKTGYAAAQKQFDGKIGSIAVDSWCNDYALFTENGTMLETPRNYRDSRTEGWIEKAATMMPKYEVYRRAGQQFARFETCYHLLAQKEQDGDILKLTKDLLFVPDCLSYLLGAKKYTEYTIASVTNLYNILKKDWDEDILRSYGLDRNWFSPVVTPGSFVGRVSEDICRELHTVTADIYAVGAHDTASAVAAVPAVNDEEFLFISSGTWSLVGAELRKPILSQESMEEGFGNEGGVQDRTRYIRNVMGLWIIQECARIWKRQGKNYSFAQLADMAEKVECAGAYIDPDDERLFEPADMPAVVAELSAENGYYPQNDAEIVRIISQSLACKYRYVIEKIEKITGKSFDNIHIIGGGSQNDFLNRLTADVCRKTVFAGPADATGIGNILTQWFGRGILKDLKEARETCARSVAIKQYHPSGADCEKQYRDFLKVTQL
ncbi:MAG: rhamnulokinase family protein [Christensenella sp.]|nr:rhamnulokinase family protein [Christensenella sp.]